ncbi:uracil-DNA glycosylase [bacterium endosymbiont of Escarpia laminata]|nr:MAG: uracil-DNA glycosylase [bacterium endosymbiont of Escarpia laminata]
MTGPVVICQPVISPIMLVGQAPGDREGPAGKPFAWTAGKTLFKWFDGIGLDETQFRSRIYMTAVCRCFPGKNPKGGDRVPSKIEIANCSRWIDAEVGLLKPRLLIPVGKLAMARFMKVNKLVDIVGKTHQIEINGLTTDVIPLPHPSGLNTWFRTEPGKTLLQQAMSQIGAHRAWQSILDE